MAHTSEYEIEDIFIDRLEGIGYKFIKLNNYDEVLANFREQLAKFNAKKLEEKGHTASFSDSEFNRIMIHVDNHSVYESAKVLPANLFHGTGIPVCVLVLKSNRNGNSGNILFIDASKEFKPGKNQNILEQEHIDKIVDAYEKRAEIDKFAHKAYMSEIIENGYNLNIPRYVDTFEEEEPVDLDAVRNRIKTLDSETKAAIDKAESFMRELGL
jgi:type I restriction-modification system DNA methylase subunit